MDNDCDQPFLDGITIDDKFRISAITDFTSGWNDPVCVVCENKDEKVGIEITIDQLPCTSNCPTSKTHGTGACKGFLDHVQNPPKIEFNYSSS